MESVQFGQSCHVMKPEYVGHQASPHARVTCVECHVEPGVTGWIESKMNGTRQLFEVALDSYPRPIPGALRRTASSPRGRRASSVTGQTSSGPRSSG